MKYPQRLSALPWYSAIPLTIVAYIILSIFIVWPILNFVNRAGKSQGLFDFGRNSQFIPFISLILSLILIFVFTYKTSEWNKIIAFVGFYYLISLFFIFFWGFKPDTFNVFITAPYDHAYFAIKMIIKPL